MRVPCFPLSKELLFSTYYSTLNITDLQNVSKSLVLSGEKKGISFSTFVRVRRCTHQLFTHAHTHTTHNGTYVFFLFTHRGVIDKMALIVHGVIASATLCFEIL